MARVGVDAGEHRTLSGSNPSPRACGTRHSTGTSACSRWNAVVQVKRRIAEQDLGAVPDQVLRVVDAPAFLGVADGGEHLRRGCASRAPPGRGRGCHRRSRAPRTPLCSRADVAPAVTGVQDDRDALEVAAAGGVGVSRHLPPACAPRPGAGRRRAAGTPGNRSSSGIFTLYPMAMLVTSAMPLRWAI